METLKELFSGISGDKPWYKSLTILGVVLFAGGTGVIEEAFAKQMITLDTAKILEALAQYGGGSGVVLGLRKALATKAAPPTTPPAA